MKKKVPFKWLWSVVGIAVISLSAVIVLFLTFGLPAQDSYAKQASIIEQTDSEFRLKIPGIKTDAVIENVGLTPDGAMDVPKGPKNVAWFDLGSRPGEPGSAVIAGHSGWKNGIPAVFDNLSKLKKGDKIFIQDKKGAVITFIVREIRNYDPNADAGDVFGSSDGKAHLNLVTCGGVWNAAKKTHSQRLVVFTDQEVK
jgi:sortase A